MLRKAVLVFVLICLCCSCVPALDMSKAEPYDDVKFPKWTIALRRGEILFFGGLPIAYPITSLILNTMKKENTFWKTLGISCCVTASIALIDFIIGLIKNR
ncbi:MAG: hypothetical protein MJ052_01045 [Sphaerochaetaceae bacterium]|nr:hypothetical protein [Sphaerochaetaceae bacterium]